MMGTRIAVNAQNLTLSDVQNSGCLRENQRRANGEGQMRAIILTKEGTILTVQILGFVSNCATMGFDVTPSMSGGSDGTPCSVSVQVEPIYEEEADCICPFNVSFTLHGLEANSFYFSCWWYEGQVSLTDGEPLTLESITEPVQIDDWYFDWYCIIDKVNHTAIVEGVDGGTSELLIPWVLSYEGEEYYVTGIGEHAFINYKALTSVTLPTNLTHIGDYAFAGCDNLTDVYCFADKVPTTGSNVFHGTPIASATLHVPAGMVDKYKATSPWSNFGNIVGEGEVTIDGLNYYLNSSFYTAPLTKGNTWEGELDIPSEISFYGQTYRVTSMALTAFRDNTKLTKVRIPKNLESILHGYYTTNPYEDVPTGLISSDCMNPFIGCTALESIEVDEENPSLKSIDGVLFSQDGKGYYYYLTNSYYGTGLYCYPAGARRESYTIPDGVEWIGSGAFDHNQYISTLTIPSSLKQICNNVFAGCNNLKDIYCYAENVPIAFSEAFKDFSIASATLHVPAGSVEKYKATSPWSSFGNIVAIEETHHPLLLLEGNPIWVYKYEHIPTLRDPYIKCWLDTGDRSFTYYFLCGQKEIDGKLYKMMGEVRCDRAGKITLSRWLPVREENGIVYAITDSLPGVVETEDNYDARYNDDNPMPYLKQGNECVLYNFSTSIGETLYPQNEGSRVKSIDTYQLLDGTECRVLKTQWAFYDLYEKLGLLNADPDFGIMDPFIGWPVSLNGHIYLNILNAYYQDNIMLYKAPDARDGLCVNDTCWTRDDAEAYARSYKADPRQEEVFSYIRQLQKASTVEPVTYTEGQIATIILPTAPDAGKGKYYRLDRCEEAEGQTGRQIVFEEEIQPRARVPYIIVPGEDFSIDPSTLDLAGLNNDTVSTEGVSFIGTYDREELNEQEGFYIDIIDTTPDCQALDKSVVGALRAYLQVTWNDPYNQGGTKTPPMEKLQIVLKDMPDGIEQMVNRKSSNSKCYDLQGRKVANPRKGIYIKDGEKVVVK